MKLTREQRAAFFDRKFPKISGEGICPVTPGDSVRLSSRLSFTVDAVNKTRAGGWSLSYTIYDQRPDRDRYLGGAPALSEAERLSKKRWHPDDEHGYTGNPMTALADAGTCVDPLYQEQLTADSRRKWALYESKEKTLEVAYQQQRALANKLKRLLVDAAKTGVDITPHLASALRAAEKEIEEARNARVF